MQNRRKFISGGAAATAAISAAPMGTIAESAINSIGVREVGSVPHAKFAELLQDSFRIRGTEASVKVELVDAGEALHSKNNETGDKYESYSLVFSTPVGQSLPEGQCELEHARLGSLKAFVVPWHTTRKDMGQPLVISVCQRI